MAGDLIPPPSPAGKAKRRDQDPPPRRQWLSSPEPATEAELRVEREEERAEIHAEPRRELPRLAPDSPYRPRFGFLFGALIGVVIAGAAAALLLVRGADDGVPRDWSQWRPSTSEDLAAAQEIAAHVAPKYRLLSGEQMVAVRAEHMQVRDLPFEIALRGGASGGGIEFINGDGILFTLTGLGPLGSITKGQPTEARHLLLRREALELALYTLRYAKDVDHVVALLPPPPPKPGQSLQEAASQNKLQALLFRADDLRAQLDAPSVRATVPEDRTPRPETLGGEAARIQALTRPNLFFAAFQQSQDSQLFLVLDPIPGG
jgi:hypothetical protein